MPDLVTLTWSATLTNGQLVSLRSKVPYQRGISGGGGQLRVKTNSDKQGQVQTAVEAALNSWRVSYTRS